MALQFPYDNRDDYPGKIIFRPFAPPVPDVTVPGILALGRDLIGEFNNSTNFGDGGVDDARAARNRNVDPGNNIVYGSQANRQRRNYDVSRKVTLYLPQAIVFNDVADYDTSVQLGAIGGVAENTINRGGSAAAALVGAATQGASTISDLFTGNTGAAGEAARLAATRVSQVFGDTAGNVAGSVLRVAVNPNKRTLFRAVNLREFTFQFKMIANSPREAQEIENIVKTFRTELYPSVVSGAEIVGYNFPNLFDIQMKYNNQPVASKIKPSYLRSVSVTYNPSSMGWHIDGKPSEVDMTLAFVEERTLNKADVAGGY